MSSARAGLLAPNGPLVVEVRRSLRTLRCEDACADLGND
jgi:hypothetical protein